MISNRYDIEADWTMFHTCNYTCEYCFFSKELLQSKLKVEASNDAWQKGFNDTNLIWQINITGGEPTIYPNFADLCTKLTQKHYISINTNLTRSSIRNFANMVDPSRVTMINAGFHPMERTKRSEFETFLDHFDLLRDKGFNVIASIVGDPEALDKIEEFLKIVESRGIVLVPKAMRGAHKGQTYPQSYSDSNRETFRKLSQTAREFYGPMLQRMKNELTVNPFDDDKYLNEIPQFHGMVCESGRSFVMINPQGYVSRCPNIVMGNILKNNFHRNKLPSICNSEYCYYFCQKYALTDENPEIINHRKSKLIKINQINS